jgi:hypothetical protein
MLTIKKLCLRTRQQSVISIIRPLFMLPLIVLFLIPSGSAAPIAAFHSGTAPIMQSYRPSEAQTKNPGASVGGIPPMPNKVGCYEYTHDLWVSMPCLSPEKAASLPRPNEGGGFGVEGVRGGANILNALHVGVTFTQFSGESDSQYGSNDWSIQANTNYFAGNNGHNDWVQFVEANWPTRYGWFGGMGRDLHLAVRFYRRNVSTQVHGH